MFVLSHPNWDVIPRGCLKGSMGCKGSQRLTLALGLFGLCPRVPSKLKLFGTLKASEVSRAPVKVASVSIECSQNACAWGVKLSARYHIAGVYQVTFCAWKKGGESLSFFPLGLYSCSCVCFLSHKVGILAYS